MDTPRSNQCIYTITVLFLISVLFPHISLAGAQTVLFIQVEEPSTAQPPRNDPPDRGGIPSRSFFLPVESRTQPATAMPTGRLRITPPETRPRRSPDSAPSLKSAAADSASPSQDDSGTPVPARAPPDAGNLIDTGTPGHAGAETRGSAPLSGLSITVDVERIGVVVYGMSGLLHPLLIPSFIILLLSMAVLSFSRRKQTLPRFV